LNQLVLARFSYQRAIKRRLEIEPMKTLSLVAALLLGATAIAAAQSQPNFGPNAPATGDSFGKPPSGAQPPMSGTKAYAYRGGWYHHRHHRRYRHVHD
jgi:hypothetical protein